MFDLINGLPVHPLVVHAVVVLVPLAALGTIAIVARPAWRARFGVLVVAAAAIGTILTPVSTSSGEALEKHVGDPGKHAELGDQLIWFMIPLLVLALAVVLLDRRRARAGDSSTPRSGADSPTVFMVVAALAVVAAVATTVQVYRIGDSGARAAWGDQVSSSAGESGS
ncbi:hypothetical protein H5V45_21105 [Nocardioides sp. KIGAM211]|uniref:DUF2231 domain-containing protein n=1 Tax=Nocardioides luti TaxID=2761101 RepID=A0A7X0RKG3_9ACTN|nr:DUF2231 domain-containing protein [Nocardioides luti]MBB6629830.1 hypothetical protein [Nocardioides luti]